MIAASPFASHLPSSSPVDRRQALVGLGSVAASILVWPPAAEGSASFDPVKDDALDDVLRQMQREEPGLRRGLSTHLPMAAEALCALGYSETVADWSRQRQAPLRTLAGPSQPIDPKNWQAALGLDRQVNSWDGANRRWADWREFFVAELASRPWEEVLDQWVGRLAPGLSGAATHGVIRTAHAARALGRRRTPERVGELARGLAYWASSYETLPARPRQQPGYATFAAALDEVPLYREAFGQQPEGRNIVEVLRGVAKLEAFADVRDAAPVPEDLEKGLSALTATFARVYLRYGTPSDRIAFIHAVTGPTALRRLLPHLSPATARATFPYAWQAAAAIFAAYVPKRTQRPAEETRMDAKELAELAVKNGDEHAIKFTEVMLAEYALNPDPIYLAAAADAVRRL